jgi:CrcB protein
VSGGEWLGIALLGGVGAVARLLLDARVSDRVGGDFPLGTLVVNLLGSLVLGALAGAAVRGAAAELLGTGLVGAFTTFSTWMLESQRLAEGGRGSMAVLNLLLSLLAGLGAAWAGFHLGRAL